MKLIRAVIQPHKADAVRDALTAIGASGLTAIEVKGFGRQKGHNEVYRGAEYVMDFVAKVQVDVVVKDEHADQTAEAIIAAARSGRIGDGKIFVSNVEDTVRIRTGETGDQALSST